MSMMESDDKMGRGDSDVDIETTDPAEQPSMDQQLSMAFESTEGPEDQAGMEEGKSRLLEDLLMSDVELSDGESEDEGDNPFATRSDSENSEDGREDITAVLPKTDIQPSTTHLKEDTPGDFDSVTSYLDAALMQANSDKKPEPA
uniref:Uncharacterized protein n=1 Tax=Ciona savignyi TaxID=51511 RepID=H2YZ43_CIOSA